MQYTAVIILNYNNALDTINCIESVEKYNTSPIKYIVVDNGSTKVNEIDKVSFYLKETFPETIILRGNEKAPNILPRMTYLVSEKNDGYAEGNNKGLRLVYNDVEIEDVLVLNSDILFVEDIISNLKNSRSKISDCGIISPVLYKKDLKDIDYNCARKSPSNKELILFNLFLEKNLFGILSKMKNDRLILKNLSEDDKEINVRIDIPSGSCMLIEKKIIQEIDGFDPNTFLYYEENILYKKLEKLGLYCYLNRESKCIHLGASTTKQKRKSFLIRCSLESMNYYFKKYAMPSNLEICMFDFSMFLQKLKLSYFSWKEKKK